MARISQDPRIRRNEILDAAEECFTVCGYKGTTIGDIAKVMGVAKGMFYYYFRSKEEILEAALSRHTQGLASNIEEIVNQTALRPAEKISLIIKTIVTGAFANNALLEAVQDESNLNVKKRLLVQVQQELGQLVVRSIEEGCRAGVFAVGDMQATVDFIFLLVTFMIEAHSKSADCDAVAVRAQIAELAIARILGAEAISLEINKF